MKFKTKDDLAREMYANWNRENPGDAGLDLYYHSLEDDDMTINTGVAVEIPHGCAGFVFMRSSIGFNYSPILANCVGVIDAGYRGWIKARFKGRMASYVSNTISALIVERTTEYGILEGPDEIPYSEGDRILQLVVMPVVLPVPELVDELSDSERGTGGIGSTGVK